MSSKSDRRRFLAAATGALIALMSGLIVAPVVAFVTSPIWRRHGTSGTPDDFSDAGAVASIPVATWTLLRLEIVRQDGWDKTRQSRSVWAYVAGGAAAADVKILSPICPHLGCPIAQPAASSQFKCPCHGGTFSMDGTLVGGPPSRGMDSLEFQIRNGHLWVRWQDFRTGLHERVAVEI
jgi:menaquinol-cytochrome c reductase iron-sulfur subunit